MFLFAARLENAVQAPGGNAIQEKCLIVNADDFGLDPEINRGIEEACRDGIVRSVSLLATGKAFEDAVERTPGLPGVGIGIHLCLVAERSVLSAAEIPGLVDEKNRFPANYRDFFIRLWTGRIRPEVIARELDAQFRKVLDRGIRLTHADSHQYVHLIPAISTIVMELCKKYGVKWIRYPQRAERHFPLNFRAAVKTMGFVLFGKSQVRCIQASGLRVPDRSIGFLESGNLDVRRMRAFLGQTGPGVNDLTVHPGYFPRGEEYAAWKYRWETELAVLKDEAIMRDVRAARIRIGNYAD